MSRRRRWLVGLAVAAAAVALFAVVAGGFLWPRPQFRLGPWATPADSQPSGELAPPPANP